MRALVIFAFFSVLLATDAAAQPIAYSLHPKASFRGLSVTPDGSVWVSGSKGAVFIRSSPNSDWRSCSPDSLDFRSLHAFDSLNALVASAGSPARIYQTTDGGSTWTLRYELKDSMAFLDALCFCDRNEGYALGDPIDGRLFLLKSYDGGRSWSRVLNEGIPAIVHGEAFFAASGTALQCFKAGWIKMVSGGSRSRLFESRDGGINWSSTLLPMQQGNPSQGAFSIHFYSENQGIIVGGDYQTDSSKTDHILLTANGKSWQKPDKPTGGYRECVQWVNEDTAYALGPSGLDRSTDRGHNWFPVKIETKGLHVLKVSTNGKELYMAGNKGQVIYLSLRP